MLFNGDDQAGSSNLWVTDGTGAGTSELSVAGASPNGLNPLGITVLGSKVLFEGVDASDQTNLWVYGRDRGWNIGVGGRKRLFGWT